MSRRLLAYTLLAAAAGLPRLVVLLIERGDILADYTEKSDDFARTFVESGTYGFIPGEPSAYTQPLYGFFLVPVYALLERHWTAVGLAQVGLAIVTAWLVYELGRRFLRPGVAALGAAAATLSPYLVWHDVHVNREIADQPVAVGLVLLTVLAAQRSSPLLAAGAGLATGLAVLGNSRLALLPAILAAFVAWRIRPATRAAAAATALVLCTGLAVAPWVARNAVAVGCATVTTDARALWKANNERTRALLGSGQWIDAVPAIPGAPPTPQDAGAIYRETGRVVEVDECAQMRFYQELVLDFWAEHPGEKARLAAQATAMLWDPRTTSTTDRPGAGTLVDDFREIVAPAYTIVLYALASAGIWLVPRRYGLLLAALLAYQTATAAIFAGATRYRTPWDFLLALLAAQAAVATAVWARERFGARREPLRALR